MKYILILSLIVVSNSARAVTTSPSTTSNSSSKGGIFRPTDSWAVAGGGTLTAAPPNNSQLSYMSKIGIMFGADFLVHEPFYLAFSLGYWGTEGKMNYNYTDAVTGNYSAQGVTVNQTMYAAEIGLQVRLIDTSFLHLFVEGGGLGQLWVMSFNFLNATNISGTVPANGTSDGVFATGEYGKAGLDIMLPNNWGIRMFGQVDQGSTSAMKSFGSQKVKFVDGEGYLGLVKHL